MYPEHSITHWSSASPVPWSPEAGLNVFSTRQRKSHLLAKDMRGVYFTEAFQEMEQGSPSSPRGFSKPSSSITAPALRRSCPLFGLPKTVTHLSLLSPGFASLPTAPQIPFGLCILLCKTEGVTQPHKSLVRKSQVMSSPGSFTSPNHMPIIF